MVNGDGNTTWTNKNGDAPNGMDITKSEINLEGTIGNKFTGAPWKTANGKLPGLFGAAIDMPDFLIDYDLHIAGTRSRIHGAKYGPVNMVDLNDKAAAKALVEGVIAGLDLNGVTAVIESDSFEAAVEELVNTDGSDGFYKFIVKLTKGTGTPQMTNELALTIKKTPYDPVTENAAIDAAKGIVEEMVFDAIAQADAGDVDAAEAFIKGVLDAVDLDGVSCAVTSVKITLASAETVDANGEDGEYEFTVRLSLGKGAAQTTKVFAVVITRTPYDTTDDNAAIGAANTLISGTNFETIQVRLNKEDLAKKFVEDIIGELDLNGVNFSVATVVFTAAKEGTAENKPGTNGSYTFNVTLTRGKGTAQTTDTLTLTITASAFDKEQDDADIAFAKAEIDKLEFEANQADINDKTAVIAKIEEILSGLDIETQLKFVQATLNDGTFTAAIEGTKTNKTGTDGSYTFTVELAKGNGTPVTNAFVFVITATPYDSTADDNLDIAAVKNLIEDMIIESISEKVANTEADAKAYIEGLINKLDLSGVEFAVGKVDFSPAVTGNEVNNSGVNGTYKFNVILTKDRGTAVTTKNLNLTINAICFDPGGDNAAIQHVKEVIEDLFPKSVLQADINSEEAALAYLNGLIGELELYGVDFEIIKTEYKAAAAGDSKNKNGTNGYYKFKVTLSKDFGDDDETIILTLNITATPYTGKTGCSGGVTDNGAGGGIALGGVLLAMAAVVATLKKKAFQKGTVKFT